jgi:hypothetical protein
MVVKMVIINQNATTIYTVQNVSWIWLHQILFENAIDIYPMALTSAQEMTATSADVAEQGFESATLN